MYEMWVYIGDAGYVDYVRDAGYVDDVEDAG